MARRIQSLLRARLALKPCYARPLTYLAAPLIALGLLALMLRPWPGRQSARADGPARNGITITAEGSASLPPDLARISGNVITQAGAAADALSQNDSTVQAIIAAVKGLGATDQDIQTSGVQVSPISSPQGLPTSYEASDQITVTTKVLTAVGGLIQAMVAAGITNLNSVNYALQDPSQLQLLATQAAIANARSRAQAVATSLGEQLGTVLNFSFGAGNAVPTAPPPPTVAATAPPPPFAIPAPAPPPPPPVNPTSFSTSTQVTVTFAIAGQ